jgi:hypothetical protein
MKNVKMTVDHATGHSGLNLIRKEEEEEDSETCERCKRSGCTKRTSYHFNTNTYTSFNSLSRQIESC